MPHDQPPESVTVTSPPWLDEVVDWERRHDGTESRMRVAIALARENVLRDGGGPFGAAIFERDSGRIVAAGVNRVQQLDNCALHGEMVAVMLANARVGSYTLDAPGLPAHELVTSCEPCAMCLGATLWSGVRRLVFGALRADASAVGFDEGPVFPESHAYLRDRGIEIVGGILREDARAVLELYVERGGRVY
ncbi:MAG TPA: nucleoside deaminase [Gemmatimonadaceae bacterium]|nr:nucleoside deaminase [Gemmatimonadaceae bacterium]